MMIWIALIFNMAVANTPDYRAEYDRTRNQTWAGRPIWSKHVPKEVTVYYADIPEQLKTKIKSEAVDFDYHLPEFAKVKNRFFWIEDPRVFYLNDGLAQVYMKQVNKFIETLLINNIKIHSHLRGKPLTSKATLKVYDPQNRQDYMFIKLLNDGHSLNSLKVSEVLNFYNKKGMGPDFYPEVEEKMLYRENRKKQKMLLMPMLKIRSSRPIAKFEIEKQDIAMPLHALMSDERVLEKVAGAHRQSINDWFLETYSRSLSKFIYNSYYVTGVLPHAHSQNIVAILSEDLKLKGFVMRDLLDFHYNPIIALKHLKASVFHLFTDNVVNYSGADMVSRFERPLQAKLDKYFGKYSFIRKHLYKTKNIESFEFSLAAYFGRVFDLMPGAGRGEFFNKRVFFNFISFLSGSTLGSTYEPFIEKAAKLLMSEKSLVDFQFAVSKLYHDVLMDEFSHKIAERDLQKNYLKSELAKTFVEAMKINEVGFFSLGDEKWREWNRAGKYKRILNDIIQNNRYDLYSDGEKLIMLKDTSMNKWIALSYKTHTPTRLLPVQNKESSEFAMSAFSCRILFQ